MENEEEIFKRLDKELDAIEKQKAKNKLMVEKSEYEFLKSVLKDKEAKESRKITASVYTAFTLIAFAINPAFGVFVVLFFIADSIFNFLKIKK